MNNKFKGGMNTESDPKQMPPFDYKVAGNVYTSEESKEAWEAWEEDQKTNPDAINPHAFVYGYKMAMKKYKVKP